MLELFFDGACEPINPGGTASYGWLIKKDGKEIASGCGIIGKGEGMTNNVAEYWGVLEGVRKVIDLNLKEKIIIKGDSSMVCNMVSMKWGWKKKKWNPHPKFPHLKKFLDETHDLLVNSEYEVVWIPREENFEADALSKKPLGIVVERKEEEKCENCGSYMVKRKGVYGEFWGCKKYPKCKFTMKIKDL